MGLNPLGKAITKAYKWIYLHLLGSTKSPPELCYEIPTAPGCGAYFYHDEDIEQTHKATGVLSKREKGKTRIVNPWQSMFKKFLRSPHRYQHRNRKLRHQRKYRPVPGMLPENTFVTPDMAVPPHNVIDARSIGGHTMDQSTQILTSLYLICALVFMFVFAAALNWCLGKNRSLDSEEVERRRLLDAENAWLNYEEGQEEEWNVEGVPEGLGSLTN